MKEFYRRHLPHWQPRNAIFFVTFRLKGSLPYEVIEALRAERDREKILQAQLPERTCLDDLETGGYFDKWDSSLDHAKFGPRWLAQPEIAEILNEAMLIVMEGYSTCMLFVSCPIMCMLYLNR